MGQKITGLIFVVLLIVIVVFTMLGQGNRSNSSANAAAQLYEKIMEWDIDNNYPQTPTDVIRMNNEITRYLYSGYAVQGNIAAVVLEQRKLMGHELLEINSEYDQIRAVEAEVQKFKDNNYFFISLSQLPPYYYEDNTNVCSIRVIQYSNSKEIPKNYVIYYLSRQPDSKWKIMGWELSDVEFSENLDS